MKRNRKIVTLTEPIARAIAQDAANRQMRKQRLRCCRTGVDQMARYSGFKYRCPGCSKKLRGVIPAHGDGSAYVFPRHKEPSGKQCDYSRMLIDARSKAYSQE